MGDGPAVTGRQVEVIIGHYVAACMYCCAGLAVMRSVYDFIRDRYVWPTRLWPSVRYECEIMAGLCILLRSDLARPWLPLMYCSDASTTGYGVAEKALPADAAAETHAAAIYVLELKHGIGLWNWELGVLKTKTA